MPSPNPYSAYPEPSVNPLAPVEQLARAFAQAAVDVVLGLAIGMLAARLMRSRHLHWSWAAGSLAIVVLAQPVLASATAPVGTAALAATMWGRRWHREDIEAGTDLAEIAAARRGPLVMLRSLARRVALRRSHARGEARWSRGERLLLGHDHSGRTLSIPFASAGGGTHTLVVGATGSGKTVTQSWIAARAIEQGMGAIVIDPKGDSAMRSEVRNAARAAGRPFIEWTPQGPWVYNPFGRGGDTEIADKALAGERFTEPHYLRQAQRYLGHLVRVLRRASLEVSLRTVVEHLDPAELERLTRGLPESRAQPTHAYLDSLSTRQRGDLAGVRDRLAILAESDVGPWLDPQTPGVERFDLVDTVKHRAVVYFSLESDKRPLLSHMLGAAIVQDLQTTVAALQGRPIPTLVVVDEFSAVAAEQVTRLFARARSAGFSLLLSTQELSDLRLPGRERMLEQILGNLTALVAHRQVVPESARLIASLAGTKGAWRTSRHSDGRTTRTRTREGVLDADAVMGLGTGWAAVFALTDGGLAGIARVFSPTRRR